MQEQDTLHWYLGQYFASALDCTVCNNGLWRKKGSKPHGYIEKPILLKIEQEKAECRSDVLSEEEKKRKTEELFMNLRIMGANFNINHKN